MPGKKIYSVIASSARDKGTLKPSAFDAYNLLISNKKRNRQDIKENEEKLEKQPEEVAEIRNLIMTYAITS